MDRKNDSRTISLSEAVRSCNRAPFNLMIKPVGSGCNLACRYCYYLDKAEVTGLPAHRMTEEMLEAILSRALSEIDSEEFVFNWHGGEPLLAGKDFYRKVLSLQKRFGNGRIIKNTIQTNAVLLDREWCDIFSEGAFLVGVSIDGPSSVHDRYRQDRGGRPCLKNVLHGISLLRQNAVPFNTLTAVSKASSGHGKEVYRFLKSIGSRFLQLNPVLEYRLGGRIVPPGTEGASLASFSISAEEFGNFACDIFDEWIREDVGIIYVNLIEDTFASWCGFPPGTCTKSETCGSAVVEHNGDVFACDHFVYSEYRIGNILEESLRTILFGRRAVDFSLRKRDSLPGTCHDCPWLFACQGECPQHRLTGEENLLCKGYRMFFSHAAPYMDRMRELLKRGLPPALIMRSV